MENSSSYYSSTSSSLSKSNFTGSMRRHHFETPYALRSFFRHRILHRPYTHGSYCKQREVQRRTTRERFHRLGRSHLMFSSSSLQLALPQSPRLEPRDVSQTRRHIHETEVDLWQEPDSRAAVTFMLRPRFIQEGIGCKLICCVTGKPTPKVKSKASI
jgi:hypothetical protein